MEPDSGQGDDDEPVVKSWGDQEVGIKVKKAYISAFVVPTPKSTQPSAKATNVPRIPLNFRRKGSQTTAIGVIDPHGIEFGSVDHRLSQTLAPLMDASQTNKLRCAAFIEARRRQPDEPSSGTSITKFIPMVLWLHCPQTAAAGIRRFLESKGISIENEGATQEHRTFNPNQQGCAADSTLSLGNGASGLATSFQAASSYRSEMRSGDQIRNDVHDMFRTIINTEELPERSASTRILTPLLSHQKKALHFMVEREKDRSADEYDARDPLFKVEYRGGQKSTSMSSQGMSLVASRLRLAAFWRMRWASERRSAFSH